MLRVEYSDDDDVVALAANYTFDCLTHESIWAILSLSKFVHRWVPVAWCKSHLRWGNFSQEKPSAGPERSGTGCPVTSTCCGPILPITNFTKLSSVMVKVSSGLSSFLGLPSYTSPLPSLRSKLHLLSSILKTTSPCARTERID